MPQINTLLAEVEQIGGQLWLEHGKLKYKFPKGKMTHKLFEGLKQNKEKLIQSLREPPPNIEETEDNRLEMVLDRLNGVKRSSKGYLACCPAHPDKNPSLSAWENDVGEIVLKCFAGCTRFSILQALDISLEDLKPNKRAQGESRSPRATCKKQRLINDSKKTEKFQDRSSESEKYQKQFTEGSIAAKYLASRGIPFDVARKYGLGFASDKDWKGWRWGRITVPHTTSEGHIANIYARAIGEKDKLKSHHQDYFKSIKHRHMSGAKGIFNVQALQADTVYITEGVFDCLALILSGHENSCALFGVDGLRWEWVKATNVVFALDNDEAGEDAWKKVKEAAKAHGKQISRLDKSVYKGCKDLNETWVKHGSIEIDVVSKETTDNNKPVSGGYSALGSNEKDKLMKLKEQIIQAGICSLDYESNSDPDDQTQDPQDTEVVGASVSYRIGEAFYLPTGHSSYKHNWDRKWLFANFLKPILAHPDVLILAHNMIVEHMWSILNGVDMNPKTKHDKVLDTMMMVKALALPETVDVIGKVRMGLKPATKALLANNNGMVHGLLHVDEIKSFKETVGKVTELVPDPSGAVYKTNSKYGKKGEPKMLRKARTRRFDELPLDPETIDYACSDADWALGLYHKLKPICEKEKLTKLVYFNTKRMMLLGEYQLSGWQADPNKIEQLRSEAEHNLYGDTKQDGLEQQLEQALLQLAKEKGIELIDNNVVVPAGKYFMGKHHKEDSYLEIKTDKEFSWKSVQHRQWLFFHVLGIDTKGLKRSKKTGLPQVDSKNMSQIMKRYAKGSSTKGRFMQLLEEKNSYDKVLSTYVQGMGDFIRRADTNKIHTNFRLVDTWRLASSKPNLQNIPRAENDPLGIRNVFVAPTYDLTKDYTQQNSWTQPVNSIIKQNLSGETMWIGCDYSQLELRVMAWYSREQAMIDAFHRGEDLHSATAKLVFNLDCAVNEVKSKYKPYRYRAKAVNFGLVYGITEFGLSEDPKMGLDIDEAKKLMKDYFKTYPKIKEYMDNQISFARQYGYVKTMFGHRRPIVGINDSNPFTQRRAANKAINTPVQGSGADIIALAMVNLRDEIPKAAPYLKPVMQIHDELILECPVEYVVEGQQFVKEVMERPIKGFSEVIPLEADPAVGKIWAHNLDVNRDDKGWYVVAKSEKYEPSDVTIEEIHYALPLYEKAGIEVRVK